MTDIRNDKRKYMNVANQLTQIISKKKAQETGISETIIRTRFIKHLNQLRKFLGEKKMIKHLEKVYQSEMKEILNQRIKVELKDGFTQEMTRREYENRKAEVKRII